MGRSDVVGRFDGRRAWPPHGWSSPLDGPAPQRRMPGGVARRAGVITTIVVLATVTFGFTPITSMPSRAAAAATTTPGMCNGRSDPGLHVTVQAGSSSGQPFFVDLWNGPSGGATGSLVMPVPGSAERLVVTDWCRVWQHQPGTPSSGTCGLTYPEGAVTAHAVGTTRLNGQDLLVRTDVRQLATGEMSYRVRYRPLAAESVTDDCETGWTKLPAEGWYPLDVFRVDTGTPPAGYQLAARDGGVFSFDAPFNGSMGGTRLNGPVVGIAGDPVTSGYRLVTTDGGVFSFNAPFNGSMGGTLLNGPVVGMAEDPLTDGYWLAASDGGVFAIGDAPFSGSVAGWTLNKPVVGMAADLASGGYWLVAADGGVFALDSHFYGSAGGSRLNAPVVGMVSTPSGHGYWLAAADGGVFAYGDAGYFGSGAGRPLSVPVVGMAATADGRGYWLAAADGRVLEFGDAGIHGSTPSTIGRASVAGMAAAT